MNGLTRGLFTAVQEIVWNLQTLKIYVRKWFR